MTTRKARTVAPLLLLTTLLTTSCGDITSPAQAQTTELAQIQAQLAAVIERLDAMEESQGERFNQIDSTLASNGTERFDEIDSALGSIQSSLDLLSIDVGVAVGATAAVAASVCAKKSLNASVGYKTFLGLKGRVDGMVGVDAYGNGANATLAVQPTQRVNIKIDPGIALELQLCGNLSSQTGVSSSISIDAGDPIIALLEDLAASTGTDQLNSVASGLGMSGARTGQALNMLSNLSPEELFSSISGSGSTALASVLPMPAALRTRVESPRSLLSDATLIGASAIELLCGPVLRVGAFASMMQTGCDLRDQVPPPADVIGIISELDGIGVTLTSFETQLASMCGTFGSIANQRLSFGFVIPSRTIAILGQDYRVFNGYSYSYNEPLFPAYQTPTC